MIPVCRIGAFLPPSSKHSRRGWETCEGAPETLPYLSLPGGIGANLMSDSLHLRRPDGRRPSKSPISKGRFRGIFNGLSPNPPWPPFMKGGDPFRRGVRLAPVVPGGEDRLRGDPRSRHRACFNSNCYRSRGFTFIELLVVVTIITIFAAIALPTGLHWLTDYRLTQAVRSLSNAVLMARMRGIENRSVITITTSVTSTDSPFTATCPGIIFTTNVDHGLTGPNPVVTNYLVDPTTLSPAPPPLSPRYWPVSNCKCVKDLGSPPSTTPTPGDTVMFSGLDHTKSMNGAEFEVLTIPSSTQFAVQHTYNVILGDLPSGDTKGTVRNLIAPGRLRIVPATAVLTTPTNDNQENFSSSGFTIKEEASTIVFRYNTDQFQITFYAGNPPIPSDTPTLDPSSTAYNFAEIRFDNRGFPKSTLAYNSSSGTMTTNPISTNTTILIAEKLTGSKHRTPRTVQYLVSPTGKVNTTAWEE